MSRAYTSGGCILGAIFGTGTNGAYVEEVAKIPKLANSPAAAKGGYMVVNTEWGAFNNSRSHLPSTPFDNALDRTSINARFQAFEKFISGMYLGEITRHVLLSLIDAAPKPLLFAGKVTDVVNVQWALDTSVMSDVEEAWELVEEEKGDPEKAEAHHLDGDDTDKIPNWDLLGSEAGLAKLNKKTKDKLERVRGVVVNKFGFTDKDVSLRDAAIVRWACHLVARRAALLSGVAVATILIQTGRASFTQSQAHVGDKSTKANGSSGVKKEEVIGVGVDGSLIQFYPYFERTMRESLRSIVGEDVEKRVDIGLAKDGSGVGAALCALQALKQM